MDKVYWKRELGRIEEERSRLQLTITNKKQALAKARKVGFAKGKHKLKLIQESSTEGTLRIYKRLNAKKEGKGLNHKEKGKSEVRWIYQGFKLQPKLVAKLTKYAANTGKTKTEVVKLALTQFLKQKGN